MVEVTIAPKRLRTWRALKPAARQFITRIIDGSLSSVTLVTVNNRCVMCDVTCRSVLTTLTKPATKAEAQEHLASVREQYVQPRHP